MIGQKLIYVRAGGKKECASDTVAISAERAADYVIGSPRGLSAVATKITSVSAPGQHGEDFQSLELDARYITDTIHIRGKDRADMYKKRLHLLEVLNPLNGQGTLYYSNAYGEWRIPARAKVYGESNERVMKNYNNVKIEFYCEDPFWREITPHREVLYELQDGAQLPLTLPGTLGKMQEKLRINNTCALAVPVVITASGAFKGMCIENMTTGEHLIFEDEIAEGQTLVIDTGTYSAKVLQDGKDGFDILSPVYGSRYLRLWPGVNQIGVWFSYHDIGTKVTLDYSLMYAGV